MRVAKTGARRRRFMVLSFGNFGFGKGGVRIDRGLCVKHADDMKIEMVENRVRFDSARGRETVENIDE